MGSQRVRHDEQLSTAQHFCAISFDLGFVFVCVWWQGWWGVGGVVVDVGKRQREPASQKREERMRESMYPVKNSG